jgi:hypothetical protein
MADTFGSKFGNNLGSATMNERTPEIRTDPFRYRLDRAPGLPPDDLESTVWWPIPGEAGYELGDALEVRRLAPYYGYRKMPITPGPDGRPTFVGSSGGVRLSVAVAAVIHGPRPRGLVVRHLDDNPENSYASNIAYGTQAENIADSIRNGTFPRGRKNGRAKLTEGDIPVIRQRARAGESNRSLADSFGVDPAAIAHILKGKTWRHVA